MERKLVDILKKYWGHQSFRPLQEDIIESILSGKDTVALLPTGGGKSICFQVPSMAMDGLCIVISPLIALMNDQVLNLRKRGISAVAITSALSKREMDIALDNAAHGALKFLYLSPERLKTDLFQMRLKKMKISMVAIDEAHCISEWGHDFRPAYREISALRTLLPSPTPFTALTATATAEVVEDIVDKLELNSPSIFRKSFTRDNLTYVVQKESHKLNRMIGAINKLGGSGIVYVGTRRETLRYAHLLRANGIGALPYHGGMTSKERGQTQAMWISNKAQIVVATNAFGMGIDKPDVRFVIHVNLPTGIEAYFQEAGRAGRDGKKAYAICLVNEEDQKELKEKVSLQIPDRSDIKKVYRALVSYYQLATGISNYDTKLFDLKEFAKRYDLIPIKTLHCIKALERDGLIALSDAVFNPSRVQVLLSTKDLYSFEIGHPKLEPLVRILLRSYEGIFDHPTKIDEISIARRLKSNYGEVKKQLEFLKELKVITYRVHSDLPFINFASNRPRVDDLKINEKTLQLHRKRLEDKMMAVIRYSENDVVCRNRQLVAYFGDYSAKDCGRCDVCLARKKVRQMSKNRLISYQQIKDELIKAPCSLQFLNQLGIKSTQVSSALQWMADNDEISISPTNIVSLVST